MVPLGVAVAEALQQAAAQARARAASMGFRVRIWDGDEVLRRVLDVYDQLPEWVHNRVRLEPVKFYRVRTPDQDASTLRVPE